MNTDTQNIDNSESEFVKELVLGAKSLGACSLADDVTNVREVFDTIFSPQGREFCKKYNYPTLNQWRGLRAFSERSECVLLVDAGSVDVGHTDETNIAVMGDTNATLTFTRPDKIHRVFVAHGAKVSVHANDYAVVLIITPDSRYNVNAHTDGKGIILWD